MGARVDIVGRPLDLRASSAFTDVDFEKSGKQHGFISIPHSPHDDAWGAVRIPVTVIKNGSGPTAILEGGNHGDEYEGPITIAELARDLDPARIQGRLILLPAVNTPALRAGRRVSPVDGLNFNRVFPGDPRGTVTQQISAFVNDHLLPLGDAFLDLHSGGSSLNILPSAVIELSTDAALYKKNIAAAAAFGAPMAVVIDNLGDPRTATAAASRAGLITIGTEMGGGGTVSVEALALCRRGVRNVLAHLGILPPEEAKPPQRPGQLLNLPGERAYVFAPVDGVFEPFHENGAMVRAGEPAGRVHQLWDPDARPVTLRYQAAGMLYGRRQPGRVEPGNCCLVVAEPLQGSL